MSNRNQIGGLGTIHNAGAVNAAQQQGFGPSLAQSFAQQSYSELQQTLSQMADIISNNFRDPDNFTNFPHEKIFPFFDKDSP